MPKKYFFSGAKIFDGHSFIKNHDLVISDNHIHSIVPSGEFSDGVKVDAEGLIISQGFIDLQINGCGGVLFNDDISEETLDIMHKTNLMFGCTSFMPTLITTSDENIKKAVNIAKSYYKKNATVITGIHIEGPYISVAKKGAHNPIYIKTIDESMVDFLCASVKDVPIVITLAPENNSPDLINRLATAGVKVSMGHSNATYSDAMRGISSGICMSTHLYNAMSAFESRKPGLIGAILDSDVYAGIIVDGYHTDFAAVRIAKKVKGDRLYIVTDAVTSMGTDMMEFHLADQKVNVIGGACINESGALAGSNIDMMSSLKNAVEYVGISLPEALRMVTLYPARSMGIEQNLGAIRVGILANLAVFSSDFKISYVVDRGRLIISL